MSIEVWSLWITYISFAQNFKAKQTQIFSIQKHLFSTWFDFREKLCVYLRFDLLERAHIPTFQIRHWLDVINISYFSKKETTRWGHKSTHHCNNINNVFDEALPSPSRRSYGTSRSPIEFLENIQIFIFYFTVVLVPLADTLCPCDSVGSPLIGNMEGGSYGFVYYCTELASAFLLKFHEWNAAKANIRPPF